MWVQLLKRDGILQRTTPSDLHITGDLTPKILNKVQSCQVFRLKTQEEATATTDGQMFLIFIRAWWPLQILLAPSLSWSSFSSVRHLLTVNTPSFLFLCVQRMESERVVFTFQTPFNERAFISTLFPSTKEVQGGQLEMIFSHILFKFSWIWGFILNLRELYILRYKTLTLMIKNYLTIL